MIFIIEFLIYLSPLPNPSPKIGGDRGDGAK
jgi:hypothetical protein